VRGFLKAAFELRQLASKVACSACGNSVLLSRSFSKKETLRFLIRLPKISVRVFRKKASRKPVADLNGIFGKTDWSIPGAKSEGKIKHWYFF